VVKEFVMDMLFYVAGTALLAHLVICWLLQNSLAANAETLKELFAIANQGLVGKSRFQLLRVCYYLPWKATSNQTKSMDGPQRLMFSFARITGVLVPLCALSFLTLAASQAWE
jgi:hypothetical protein